MQTPWMPLYWGDYLADTAHLTPCQHGAYFLLIGHYWQKGKLPAKHEQCYSIARAFDEHCRGNVDLVLSEFFILSEDGYRHKRVDKELAKAKESYKKRSEAGKKRWDVTEQSMSNTDAMHEQPLSLSLSLSQSPKSKPALRFAPPSIEDVQLYIREKGLNVNPEEWFNYYQSNGWKTGRTGMKDWKAAVQY